MQITHRASIKMIILLMFRKITDIYCKIYTKRIHSLRKKRKAY
jgi:hypothetical protein